MTGSWLKCLVLAAPLLFVCADQSNAQTIGYAEALGQLATSCGKDIDTFCKKENLGGGKVADCLNQKWANVAPRCKASLNVVRDLLNKRSAARISVMKLCEQDRLQLCGQVESGDGNLLACLEQARNNIRPACRQAIADAGYEARLDPGPLGSQIHLSSNDVVSSLTGVADSAPGISAVSLHELAVRSLHDPSRTNRVNRPLLSEQLGSLAQLTIAIQFEFNSARIRPVSYRALGLMADSLYSPYLQGYCFLVVGNTDAVGSREYNLKLSDLRAAAIQEALINPFGISSTRIEAVGLGEEQLLNRSNPEAAENRRVQLINIGRLGPRGGCTH